MIEALRDKRRKFNSYLTTHKKARVVFEYTVAFFGTMISACLIAFGFRAFLSPNVTNSTTIISGGFSGISRMVTSIIYMAKPSIDGDKLYIIYSIIYFVINIPVIYLGWRYISRRFGIFTLINIAAVSLLTSLVNLKFIDDLATKIACVIPLNNGTSFIEAGLLPRAILAACCSGVATSIAYASGSSAGGMDTVSYYLALRKSTTIGKYMLAINSVIITLFSILRFCDLSVNSGGMRYEHLASALLVLFFAIIYLLVLSLVIDAINKNNRKEQIQIITRQENLPKLLLANIPHGATIVRAKGAFTGEDRFVIYCVVSIYETKGVIDLVRKTDPHSFINITSVKQVFGRFFIRPNR